MFAELVGIQIGQLDAVPQLADLLLEAADVVVRNVRHLLQDDLLDLRLGQLLQYVAGARLQEQIVPHVKVQVPHVLGQHDDAFLVGATDDQHPVVVQTVQQPHDLSPVFVIADLDHVQGFVQNQQLARRKFAEFKLGVHIDAQMPAIQVQVDGAVLVALSENTVAIGGRAQLLDFLLQGADILLRFPERVHELLVLAPPLPQLFNDLMVLALQGFVMTQRFLQVPFNVLRIVLDVANLFPQLLDFQLILYQLAAHGGLRAQRIDGQAAHRIAKGFPSFFPAREVFHGNLPPSLVQAACR